MDILKTVLIIILLIVIIIDKIKLEQEFSLGMYTAILIMWIVELVMSILTITNLI